MLLEEARSFIEMMYRELNYNPSIFDKRIKEIEKKLNILVHIRILWKSCRMALNLLGVTLIVVLDAYFGIL